MAWVGDKQGVPSSSGSGQGQCVTTTMALFLEGWVLCIYHLVTPRELCEAGTPVDRPGKELPDVMELVAIWNGDSAV